MANVESEDDIGSFEATLETKKDSDCESESSIKVTQNVREQHIGKMYEPEPITIEEFHP